MRTLIKSTCTLLFMFSLPTIYAQSEKPYFPEKLTLLFNNEVKMVIESREVLRIPTDNKQDSLFKYLVSDITKLQDSITKMSSPIVVSYTYSKKNRKLKVTYNAETKAEFIFTGNSDTVSSNFFNIRIESTLDKNNRLILFSNKLSAIDNLDDVCLTELIKQAQTDIASRDISPSKAKTCIYKIENNKLNIASGEIKKKGTFVISPGGDFGLSHINDRFAPKFSLSIAYVFSPKTETKSMLGITGEMITNMNPNKTYNMQGNYYMDIFYNPKFPTHPFYYATDMKMYFGYLVYREGELFQKNSFRIGLDMPAGKNFRIVLCSYSNSFKLNSNKNGLIEIGVKYKFF